VTRELEPANLSFFLRHRNPVVTALHRATLRRVIWKTLDRDLAAFFPTGRSQRMAVSLFASQPGKA